VADFSEIMNSGEGNLTELSPDDKDLRYKTHYTIRKVTEDIEKRFNFNTAISAVMELVNTMYQYRSTTQEDSEKINAAVVREAVETLIILLAPFAPHITEELWQSIGRSDSVHAQIWPGYDESPCSAMRLRSWCRSTAS
jgi:leucyl-tRNA synthetase